jgi:antitoxin component of MazEF toxin-antitoxin module
MELKINKWANSAAVRLPAPLLAQLGVQVGDFLEGEVVKGKLVLQRAAKAHLYKNDAAVAAMKFAVGTDEGMAFLHCWLHGEFDVIRKEWPEAPEAVFVGADPLHKTD